MADEWLNDVEVKFERAFKGDDVQEEKKKGKKGPYTLYSMNASFIDETGQTKKHKIKSFAVLTADLVGKTWRGDIKLYHGTYDGDPYTSYTFYPLEDAEPQGPARTEPANRDDIREQTKTTGGTIKDHPLDVQKNAFRRYTNFLWKTCKDGGRSDEAAATIFGGVRMMAGDFTSIYMLELKNAAAEKAGMPTDEEIEPTEKTREAVERGGPVGPDDDIPF